MEGGIAVAPASFGRYRGDLVAQPAVGGEDRQQVVQLKHKTHVPRAPARQRYRIMELQRWREKRGVRLNVHPKFWPFNVETADHLTVAIVESGANPDQFLRKAFPGVWADERNLADEQTLLMLADGVGLPGQKLLADAKSDSVKKRYQKNIKEALEVDAFGSPCYVLDGEVFWGQDRIELLDDALTSGRKAYRNDI